jgi:hypothetical protein
LLLQLSILTIFFSMIDLRAFSDKPFSLFLGNLRVLINSPPLMVDFYPHFWYHISDVKLSV